MKYTILLLFFATQSILSQHTVAYENAIKKFQENFNTQNVDAIFDMYITDMQETMTKDGVSVFVKGCYEQFGNLKKITFVETAEGVNTYTAEFDKTNLAMDLQLSNDGKISTIQFQEL